MKLSIITFTILFTASMFTANKSFGTDPTDQSQSLLATFPSRWLGETDQYVYNDTALTLRKSRNKATTILFPTRNIDSIGFHLDKWRFDLTTQNNYGIILSVDRSITGNISQASWEGYYISITGSSGLSQMKLIKHTLNINKTTIGLGTVDMQKAENGFDFSIIYLADGRINFKISYSNENHDIFCESQTDIVKNVPAYFGIYTNLSLSANEGTNNISIKDLNAKTFNRRYVYSGRGNIDDAINWEPQRHLAMYSDHLTFINSDSVAIFQSISVQNVTAENSTLYVINTVKTENTVLTVTNNLFIDSRSILYLTNGVSSTKSCMINVPQYAEAHINGAIIFNGKGTIPLHKIICADSAAFVFEPQSRMIVLRQDDCPFSTGGRYPAVVFKSGAIFEQHDGESPLVSSGDVPQSYFHQGSVYRYYGGGITWNNTNYSTLELHAPGKTDILMGGAGSCTIGHLKVMSGTYIFGLQATNMPVNIMITDTLTIAEGCQLSVSPINGAAFSTLKIAANMIRGKGELIIGRNAEIETVKSQINWRLHTVIAGKLRFGNNSVILLDSTNMYISGTIENASQTSFIATPSDVNNTTAYLIRPVVGTDASVLFPVGTTEYGYSPMTISRNTGSDADFSVRNYSGVYENGLWGNPLHDERFLNNAWEITPNATASVDVQIAWLKAAEGDVFDRRESKMMINHHRPSNDVWIPIEQSLFIDGEMFSVKTLAISDFSTITAWGESVPLALYFDNLEARWSDNSIETSWEQTVPTDSAQILISLDGLHYEIMQTEYTGFKGEIVCRIPLAASRLTYLKMEQYQNGRKVETSEIIAVRASEQRNNELKVTIVGSTAIVEKAEDEPVFIRLFSSAGVLVHSSLISELNSKILYQMPSRCHQCIVHAENGSGQANAIRLDRE